MGSRGLSHGKIDRLREEEAPDVMCAILRRKLQVKVESSERIACWIRDRRLLVSVDRL